MLTSTFYIYTQSPIIGQGLAQFIAQLYPGTEIVVVPNPSSKLEINTSGRSYHVIVISALQHDFYNIINDQIYDNTTLKVILCPVVNDKSILPFLRNSHFDALISIEAIDISNFKKLVSRVEQNNIFIDDFYSTEIVKSKYDRIESCLNAISDRESEVLDKIVQDKSNGQIAKELGLSIRTVNAHKRNLLKKFNAKSMEYVIDVVGRFGDMFKQFKSK